MIEKKGKTFEVRENTLDLYVINENAGKGYAALDLKEDDVVLDIGGNIGAYFVYNHDKVKHIYSYEPDNENFDLMVKHKDINKCDNVSIYKLAVIGKGPEQLKFYKNVKKNKGMHSLVPIRDREVITVDTITLKDVLLFTKANKAKIDIEGGEYELFLNTKDMSQLEKIVFEFHFNTLRDRSGKMFHEVIDNLKSKGYNVLHKDYERIKKSWCTLVVAERK